MQCIVVQWSRVEWSRVEWIGVVYIVYLGYTVCDVRASTHCFTAVLVSFRVVGDYIKRTAPYYLAGYTKLLIP